MVGGAITHVAGKTVTSITNTSLNNVTVIGSASTAFGTLVAKVSSTN